MKITREILTQRILELREQWLKGPDHPFTAEQINNGWCADFAQNVWDSFGRRGVHVVCDEDLGSRYYSHTFIRFQDLYFDSECPEGTPDWQQLPLFQRLRQEKMERV